MEAIGTLAGGVAHDLNNILSGIIGYAELAQIELAETQFKSGQYIDHILAAGKRARDLVRQVLHFSRQEKNFKGPLSVTSVVKEVVKLLRSTLPSTIDINLRLEKNSMMIWADATQIHQVIMNLCTNAYQSIGEKPGTLGISLEKTHLKHEKNFLSMSIPPGEYVRLTVSDTGGGIASHETDKIFDPYYTTKDIGKGTGLGLSVSIGVVAQHGGLIEVQSAPDQGASFSVYLPKEQKASSDTPKNKSCIRTGKNEQIMVVDDESLFIGVVTEQLGSLDYGIEAFTSSKAALQRFREASEKFKLVISDQTMPEMTGIELLAEIRKIRPDIPFIICTGYSDRKTEERLRQSENLNLLMKPVTRRELATAVFEILDRQSRPDSGKADGIE
jgi:CheY-like chemotaxis protein